MEQKGRIARAACLRFQASKEAAKPFAVSGRPLPGRIGPARTLETWPAWGGEMLVRVLHFVLGAILGAGGGYLVWTHRSEGMDIFPPAAGMPWLVIAGVLLLSAGVVFLVSAVHPRPNRRARLAAEAAERDASLGAAESYYSERARAADRDWRAGDIPEPAAPVAAPPAPAPAKVAPVVAPVVAAPVVAKPVATSAPPEAAASVPFPATATLAPIPAATEPPPAPVKLQAATPAPEVAPVAEASPAPVAVAPVAPPPLPVAPVAATEPETPFAAIRAALAGGNLDDAEKLLNAGRDTAQGLELAELTGLAGDHAAAMGRASNAKWLWRLALKRFGEQSAMDTPAARAVAESLRVAG
jgi:hypothetical protein